MSSEEEKAKEILKKAEETARALLDMAEQKEEEKHREQMEVLRKSIVDGINISVNGKIDGLRREFKEYIMLDTAWKEEDRQWKKRATPAVSLVNNTTFYSKWFGKTFIAVIKFVILMGALFGAWTVIHNFFSK